MIGMTDHPWQSIPALPEGMLPWFIGGILAGVFIATLLLRLATRLVAGFYPPWRQASYALICGQAASWIVPAIYRWALGAISDNTQNFEANVGACCVGVLSQIVTYSLVLRQEGRNSITMIQAAALSTPQIVLLVCFVSGSYEATSKPPAVSERQAHAEEGRKLLPSPPPVQAAPTGAALADAEREALNRHPDLGVAGSRMNVAFLERYRRYQKERPDYFLDAAWPMRLADETASELLPNQHAIRR
jgi:hypothetical protein